LFWKCCAVEAMAKLLLLAVPVAAWVRVPGGAWVHHSCIHEVANGELTEFPDCPHPVRAADEWAPEGYTISPKVQCYDQKAYVTAEEEFTQLNASFVVPPLPRTVVGQTVFLWPGFKGTEPIIGRPVLQPVLQSYGGDNWQLQSWAVGIPSGSMTGPRVDVREGDLITSYMQLDGDVWTVYGQNTRTGEASVLRLSHSQGGYQPYNNALFVSENVMARYHCDYYPANTGIEFKDVVVNGKSGGVSWKAAYDCGSPDCQQKVIASADGTSVQLTWNGASSVTV